MTTRSIAFVVSPDCTPVAVAMPVAKTQSPLSTSATNVTVPVMSDGRYIPIW